MDQRQMRQADDTDYQYCWLVRLPLGCRLFWRRCGPFMELLQSLVNYHNAV